MACGQTSNDYWTKLPSPKGWVNDLEKIFTEEQIITLDSLIAEYEKSTTIEIAVITIPTNATEKDRFGELTLYIAKNWAVGKKDKNNGILIAVSKGYRTIRLQNGFGIEKLLSDKQTKHIIDQKIIPNFKADNIFNGVFEGIQEIKIVLGNGKL